MEKYDLFSVFILSTCKVKILVWDAFVLESHDYTSVKTKLLPKLLYKVVNTYTSTYAIFVLLTLIYKVLVEKN